MRLEAKDDPPFMIMMLYPMAAILFTLIIGSLLVMLAGASPFSVLGLVLKGAFGSKFALMETLTRATPLIFTGLALAIAFKARLWNIGAEAQLYMGGIVTVVMGTGAIILPSYLLIPLIMLVVVMAGALTLLGPVLLKTRFGVDEVVTTLLLNFVIILIVSLLLDGILKNPMGMGWPQSKRVISEVELPRLFKGLRLHLGFIIALIAALITWVIMNRSVLGYEIRAVGNNPQASRFAGINVPAIYVKTAILSGGLAALAGFSEVAGLKGNLSLDLSPGYGYTGIIVAMIALLNPIGVVFAAVFVASIFVGADSMSRVAGVPSYIAEVLVATALLSMIVAIMLIRFRLKWK